MSTTEEDKKDSCRKMFATRFNTALDMFGIPQKRYGRTHTVAQMFKLTERGAARWLNGEVIPPKIKRKEIASLLNVSFEWLEFGHGIANPSPQSTLRDLPIIAAKDAKDYKSALANFSGQYLQVDSRSSPDSFVVEVTGRAMEPRFFPGSLLVVDPEATLKDGDFVLAHIHNIDEVIFRKYISGDEGVYFVPLSENFAAIQKSPKDVIVGIVVEIKCVLK